MRAGRGRLEPRQEAGERLLRHGQLRVPVARLGVAELDDDALGAERRRLRGQRRAAGQHRERAAVEHLLRAEPHVERAVPAEVVALVLGHPEAPGAAPGGAAQAALDGPAAPFNQVAADRQRGGGEHDEQEESGEEPDSV